MGLPKIGLAAVFQTKAFKKGLKEYTKGLLEANKATTAGASGITKMGGAMGTAFKIGIALAVAAVVALIAALAALALGIIKATIALVKFGWESTKTAGRVAELHVVTQLLGQRAGFTAQEINDQTQAIRELGIRTDVALKLQLQFARYNLDMAKATDIARVAQDAAVISMQDSSDTLDGILYGILTYNKRILRTQGLNVDLQGSFEQMADELGVTTKSLSEQQKVQAALNAVIAEGSKIAGTYEAAMDLPAKRMRSLKRLTFDLAVAMGAPFQGAW